MLSSKRTIIIILVLCLLIAVPVSGDLLGDIYNALTGGAQAQNIDPMQLQFIGASTDIISATSPVLNLSWNITNYNINPSYFTDCYLRVYTDMHASIQFQRQIINPWTINRTMNGYRLVFPNAVPQGVYYVNLQCEILNGINNLTVPYESRNLDILPLFFNNTVSAAAKTAMLPAALNYMNCQRMVGVNCPVWQQEATVGGRSWNQTYGNIVPPNAVG